MLLFYTVNQPYQIILSNRKKKKLPQLENNIVGGRHIPYKILHAFNNYLFRRCYVQGSSYGRNKRNF